MVEPMSPRFTSSSDRVPASRRPAERPLEHRDPRRAEPLEERRLGFDHGHRPGERLDAGHGEPLQTLDGLVQAPVRQQPGVGVDAGTERAELVHGDAQPGTEGLVHRCWASSPRRQSRVRNSHGVGEPGKSLVLQGCCQLTVDPDRSAGVVEGRGSDLDRARAGSDELQRVVAGAHSPDADDRDGRGCGPRSSRHGPARWRARPPGGWRVRTVHRSGRRPGDAAGRCR